VKEQSVRLNIRIPKSVFDRAMQMGNWLGIEQPTACIKYFFHKGLETSSSQFLALEAGKKQAEQMELLKGFVDGASALNLDTQGISLPEGDQKGKIIGGVKGDAK